MLPERSAEPRRGERWVWEESSWQAPVGFGRLKLICNFVPYDCLSGKGEVVICSCL